MLWSDSLLEAKEKCERAQLTFDISDYDQETLIVRKRKQISETKKKTKPKVQRRTLGVFSCHKSLFDDIPNGDKIYNGNYNSDNDFINSKPKSQKEKSVSTSTFTSASASTSTSHQNFETNDTGNV